MSAGNRETSVNLMVNGINLNDLSNSQVTFQPSINTVSEFKVDNSTFSAEYGRNSGAIVNVATRSGANQMHGEAFDFYRDDQFDSRNYFNPRASTRRERTPQSPFNRKQFGVNLGGPIVKNRSFYFCSYEGLASRAGRRPEFRHADATRSAPASPIRSAKNLLPVHPDGERPDRHARRSARRWRRSHIDQYTIDSRNNLRQSDDLHVYYAYPEGLPPRVERAGTNGRRLPRQRAAATARS